MSSTEVSVTELVQSGLLGEAIDDAPVLVFVADDERRYVAVNRYACELLGYTRDELLALRVDQIARYDEAPEEYETMMQRGFAEGVATLTRRDGMTFPYGYRARAVTVAGMKLYVAVGCPEAPLTR